jgi:hypothetical protein
MSFDVARRGLTRALTLDGLQWPALSAAVLVVRGRMGLDPMGFARLLRVPLGAARDLERGGCAPVLAPTRLADLAPDVDWAALGVPVRERPPPSEPAGRHPSGHRTGRLVL